MNEPLLKVEGLTKHFAVSHGVIFSRFGDTVKAVDDVSFTLAQGETLGLVGESGCGKSTTGRMIIRLLEPTTGRIQFQDKDVRALERYLGHMEALIAAHRDR